MSEDPAAQDFRYEAPDGTVIEAYQITPATRWQDQKWPPWLKKQRLDSDTDCVFTMSDKPDVLWLSTPGGEIELPYLAWVVKRTNGSLGFLAALEMEEYIKVVPLLPPPVHAAADESVVVPLPTKAAQEHLTNIAADTTEMRGEMMSAIRMLQDGMPTEALIFLKRSMAARTLWCNCSPGQCEGGANESDCEVMNCRQHSPLVKA